MDSLVERREKWNKPFQRKKKKSSTLDTFYSSHWQNMQGEMFSKHLEYKSGMKPAWEP